MVGHVVALISFSLLQMFMVTLLNVPAVYRLNGRGCVRCRIDDGIAVHL